jgi:hypothetical protein
MDAAAVRTIYAVMTGKVRLGAVGLSAVAIHCHTFDRFDGLATLAA